MRPCPAPAPIGLAFVCLLACTPQGAPPLLADTASADAGAPPSTAETSLDASPSTGITKPTTDAAASPYPPTGDYQVTARVISDDCGPKYTPPAPWKALIQAGAERRLAKVNLPLSAIPPSNATSSSARSDMSIEPRRATTRTSTPLPACPSYTTTQTLDIVDPSPTGFTLAISVEYGDASKCGAAVQPSKCTTKVEHVYKLVRSLCPAECTRGLAFRRPDGGGPMGAPGEADVDCRCP